MTGTHHGEGEAETSVLRGLRTAFALSLVVLLIEAWGALLSRSVSLTADAVHNVPDLVAFAVSWQALAMTAKGATEAHTFGLHRAEVFAALLNASLVFGSSIFFAYEAISSLLSTVPFLGRVDPIWVFVAAVPTLLLRTVSARVVGRTPPRVRDLNLRSVLLHLWSDVGITGAILLGAGVLFLHPAAVGADPVAALVVAAILGVESVPLFRESWSTLSEQVPPGISVGAISRAAREVPHVEDLHDVHVWSVCSSLVCMTAHVRTQNLTVRDSMQVVSQLRARLERDFGIVHAVFEVEATDPGVPAGADPHACVQAA